MSDITFTRKDLDKLERKGRADGFRVVDIENIPVIQYLTKMVVEEKSSGKFYRGRLLATDDNVLFEEVEAVPAQHYVPVDK